MIEKWHIAVVTIVNIETNNRNENDIVEDEKGLLLLENI
jgi:hypothetical protein